MPGADFFSKLVLDEDVPAGIGYKLEGRGIKILSHRNSATDREVLDFAAENEAPLLTKDEDFMQRYHERKHSGILIDNHMHLRDWTLVADTIESMLGNIPRESMRNSIWHVSDYYGVY